MQFNSFKIRNFKGIDTLTLNLDKGPGGAIYTLVGLNESGKTTALEAISYFETKERQLESLYEGEFQHRDIHDLIPMKKKANFNGSIEISATLSLSDSEKEDITSFAKQNLYFNINKEKLSSRFTIIRQFDFKDSVYQNTKVFWTIKVPGKPKSGKREIELLKHNKDKWNQLLNHIREKIPSILYFPTFLFEFPEKIFLQPDQNESSTNAYYRKLIQDILDSLNNDLDIQQHIVNRALDGGTIHQRSLDSVLTKMGNQVSKMVFERWNEVFNRKIPKKNIVIKCEVESTKGRGEQSESRVSLQFQIKDGDALYLITERSLGFRWFFCFLLITQFRQFRNSSTNTLFLFDEPASNLHSRAQIQLLKSFAKITEKSGKIIYSTHSHYMINPHWLENAYIVRNDGLKYDDAEIDDDYSSKDTNIKVDSYRQFVGENPDKLTYFQPILDTLDYIPSNLENIPEAIFVEGKNDYYLFQYFQSYVLGNTSFVKFLPGTGASGLDSLISLYLGWGRNFIIILDSDTEGRSNQARYIKEWFLPKGLVFTLQDIDPSWKNRRSEQLIAKDDCVKLKTRFYPNKGGSNLTKKEITRAIQELLLKNESLEFSKETINQIRLVINFCRETLQAIHGNSSVNS